MFDFRKSSITFVVPLLAALLSFPSGSAFAVTAVTITNLSPDWTLIPGGTGFTWALTGNSTGSSGDPMGDWLFNLPFPTTNNYWGISDPVGAPQGVYSDIITVTNNGPGGVGEIQFSSTGDPNNLLPPPAGFNFFGQACDENLDLGCHSNAFINLVDVNGPILQIELASSEVGFDPFNTGVTAGDFIRITCGYNCTLTPVSSVPLPAALPLFASGLAGLGWLGRRKKKPVVTA